MAELELNLLQFQQRFSDEEACLQAIFEARWPRGFICPDCHHNDGYRIRTRRAIQCCSCRKQTSITAETLFHRSKTPLVVWFQLIYFMAQDKGGCSALKLSNQLGMHYATTWALCRKIRRAMGARDEGLTLAGFIEMDEALFGGKFRNEDGDRKPPTHNKEMVLVLVESEGRQAGNLVMTVIPGDEWDDLKPTIESKIESEPPGQMFRADGLGSHSVVTYFGHRIELGHIPKCQQDQKMRCVSLAISLAKQFFKGTYHHFCKKNIQEYLDEFCYRWNRRHLGNKLASHLWSACALHLPIPYKALKPAIQAAA